MRKKIIVAPTLVFSVLRGSFLRLRNRSCWGLGFVSFGATEKSRDSFLSRLDESGSGLRQTRSWVCQACCCVYHWTGCRDDWIGVRNIVFDELSEGGVVFCVDGRAHCRRCHDCDGHPNFATTTEILKINIWDHRSKDIRVIFLFFLTLRQHGWIGALVAPFGAGVTASASTSRIKKLDRGLLWLIFRHWLWNKSSERSIILICTGMRPISGPPIASRVLSLVVTYASEASQGSLHCRPQHFLLESEG